MAHRYYTDEISDGRAALRGADAAHLARVLRAKMGETVILCDGNGTEYTARILAINGDREILLETGEARPTAAEPSLWAEVYLGYSKGERLEMAIQKCVELGVSRIIPFFSANCVVKPKNEETKNARYNRIATEAAKQCGRGILPRVEMPLDFAGTLAEAAKCDRALFLYECGGRPLREAWTEKRGRVAVITGPEGGFTPAEAEAAIKAGCYTVGLGPRILRCETAPIAALAALMSQSGNLE